MFHKTDKYVKNERSVINPLFIVTKSIGIVLVCRNLDSRSVYIETVDHELEKREFIKFNIVFPLLKKAPTARCGSY